MTGMLGVVATGLGLVNKLDKSKLANKVADGIDNLKLSEEERAQYILEYMKSQDDQNSTRSVVRRLLACTIIGLWALLTFASAVFWPFYPDYAKYLKEIATSTTMMVAVGSIVSFYFFIQAVRARKK
jgi:hypothetical protein